MEGPYHGMLDAEYRKMADWLSVSTLVKMQDCPAATRILTEDKKPLKFGRDFHQFGLTPHIPLPDPTPMPGYSVTAQTQDRQIIKEMWKAIDTDDYAPNLLDTDSKEVSYFWTDPSTGVKCKCRADAVHDDVCIDLKSTGIDPEDEYAWSNEILKWNYHVKARWYLNGTGCKDFVWILVRKTPPHKVACRFADSTMLHIGQSIIDEYLPKYASCLATNTWPSQRETPTIKESHLPEWYVRQF